MATNRCQVCGEFVHNYDFTMMVHGQNTCSSCIINRLVKMEAPRARVVSDGTRAESAGILDRRLIFAAQKMASW